MYRYVLFDLDGTLTDPKEGICKSVQFALHEMNIEEPDLDNLERFIGPPLKTSYREFYGMDDAQCELGVKKYRERYSTIGIFENEVYPGMKGLLAHLQEKGVHMAVASSKPKPFVDRIMEHFELASYFDVICGSDMSEKKVEKIDIMREAIAELFHIKEEQVPEYDGTDLLEFQKKAKRMIPIQNILMIGDRKFDIEGAKHFGIDSIGVSYGYAPEGELYEVAATYVTDDLKKVYEIVTDEKYPDENANMSAMKKSYRVLLPLVYDFVLKYGVLFIMQILLGFAINSFLKSEAGWVSVHSSQLAVYFDAFATIICALLFMKLYSMEKPVYISKIVARRVKKRLQKDLIFVIGFGIFLALFLNLLFSYAQIIASSEAYIDTANVQYSVSMAVGLLIYGIVKPVEEELLFRGLIYGRMRKHYPIVFCIPISALIFGAYHGNLVQLIYGFIMGCFLAFLYEKYRSIYANMIFHSAANIVVFIVSMVPVLNSALFGIAGIIGCATLSIVFGAIVLKKGN